MEVISIKASVFYSMLRQLNDLTKQVKKMSDAHSGIEIKDWLDTEDVCRILNLSKRTLQYYRSKRILPFTKLEGKAYYKPQDVEKLYGASINPK